MCFMQDVWGGGLGSPVLPQVLHWTKTGKLRDYDSPDGLYPPKAKKKPRPEDAGGA